MAVSFPPPAVRELATEVSTLLKDRSETVCVAETVCITYTSDRDVFSR